LAIEVQMNVPSILNKVLAIAGFTQAELARKVGVSQGTISKWISDQQSPNKRQWDDVMAVIAADDRLRHLLKEARSDLAEVPLLSWVSAGKLIDAESQIPVEDVPLLAFADLGSGDFFALKVDGDSMDRVSPEGSVIVINRAEKDLVAGRCYIFAVRDETTYKRWHGGNPPYLAPFSTNPANEPIFVHKKKDLEVIGRVRRTVLDL
jgi:SOS-response transcriptional repressor LexA